jgi:hypothetical protein
MVQMALSRAFFVRRDIQFLSGASVDRGDAARLRVYVYLDGIHRAFPLIDSRRALPRLRPDRFGPNSHFSSGAGKQQEVKCELERDA